LKLVNMGSDAIDGLTLISNRNRSLRNREKQWHPGRQGDVVLGTIHPGETLWFDIFSA
jgi:hypothetical protein